MNLTPHRHTNPSFEKSAIPLSLNIKPSPVYLTSVVAFHLLALVAAASVAIPQSITTILALLTIISLVINLMMSTRTRRMTWHAGDRWTLITDSHTRTDQKYSEAKLTSVDFLSRWLVILTLQHHNLNSERLVIPFDSMPKDRYRLLRVRLRIEAQRLLNPTDHPQ